MKETILPEQLAWAGEHASEAAITAIADAQVHLVPPDVLAHCETCAECNDAIAAAALLSVSTGEALGATPGIESAPASAARPPVPWRALAVAAILALFGALPSLVEAPSSVPTAAASALRSAMLIARGGGQMLRADALPGWAALVPAVALLLLGFALTRALPAIASREVKS